MKKNNKKSFWFWFLLFFNVIVGLGLLVSYTSSWIKPSINWQIAFFGLSYPLFLFFNLFFVFYWPFRKRWTFLFSLAIIALGWNTHLNYIQFNKTLVLKENDPKRIKVLTYNAHLFKPIKTNKYDTKSKAEMLGMVLKQEADIICFQEFYTRKRGSYDIEDSLKNAGYIHSKKVVFEANEQEEMSMAIFSKHKIINFEHIPFYEELHANKCIYVDIIVDGDTVRMFNVHLQSISFQPEDYQYLDKVKSDVEADVKSSKRIGYRLKRAFVLRADQSELVREHLDDSPYPVIVCGDFNDTPNSYAFHTISNGLKNAFREKGNGIGVTYNGDFPNFQIDYILCSESLEVNSYKIIKKKYSDHYPVCAEITLK